MGLERRYLHDVAFFQSAQRVEALVFFLAGDVEVEHDVFYGNAWSAKVFMSLVEVLDDRFLEFAASPSSVADQNNDGSDKGLFVRFAST